MTRWRSRQLSHFSHQVEPLVMSIPNDAGQMERRQKAPPKSTAQRPRQAKGSSLLAAAETKHSIMRYYIGGHHTSQLIITPALVVGSGAVATVTKPFLQTWPGWADENSRVSLSLVAILHHIAVERNPLTKQTRLFQAGSILQSKDDARQSLVHISSSYRGWSTGSAGTKETMASMPKLLLLAGSE